MRKLACLEAGASGEASDDECELWSGILTATTDVLRLGAELPGLMPLLHRCCGLSRACMGQQAARALPATEESAAEADGWAAGEAPSH